MGRAVQEPFGAGNGHRFAADRQLQRDGHRVAGLDRQRDLGRAADIVMEERHLPLPIARVDGRRDLETERLKPAEQRRPVLHDETRGVAVRVHDRAVQPGRIHRRRRLVAVPHGDRRRRPLGLGAAVGREEADAAVTYERDLRLEQKLARAGIVGPRALAGAHERQAVVLQANAVGTERVVDVGHVVGEVEADGLRVQALARLVARHGAVVDGRDVHLDRRVHEVAVAVRQLVADRVGAGTVRVRHVVERQAVGRYRDGAVLGRGVGQAVAVRVRHAQRVAFGVRVAFRRIDAAGRLVLVDPEGRRALAGGRVVGHDDVDRAGGDVRHRARIVAHGPGELPPARRRVLRDVVVAHGPDEALGPRACLGLSGARRDRAAARARDGRDLI